MAAANVSDWVLWLDDDLLVVNKPAGLLTIPHGYDPTQPYLVDLFRKDYGSLWVVHRLDRETSGVMVLARNAIAHRKLNTQFEQRRTQKIYHALVIGMPDWTKLHIDLPLRIDGDRKHRTIIDPRGGKIASTDVQLLERLGNYSLIEAQPHSGRRHQIRAHLAAKGHPIVVDELYGDGQAVKLSAVKPDYRSGSQDEKPLLERLGLHACELAITHPRNDRSLQIKAPYPTDFKRALNQLRKFRR
jgi:RluA family pseudouridine synthase